MLQALDYSVTLDTEQEPKQEDGYIVFGGVHEGANDQNHLIQLRVSDKNKTTQEYINDVLNDSVESGYLNTLGVTGPACPEISATYVDVSGKTLKKANGSEEELPDTQESCAQAKTLIIDVQTARQKHPDEPTASTVVAVGLGGINTYFPKPKDGVEAKVPADYQVCNEMHLCIPAMSEVNETVDPIKVRPGEGLAVEKFFAPATERDMPSAFPSGYVTVTGLLEFGEGGFYNRQGSPVAYSRLRLVATDVIPLGIAPNGKSEGKRQVQMLGQKKKVVRFSEQSEDKAPPKRRSLADLKR